MVVAASLVLAIGAAACGSDPSLDSHRVGQPAPSIRPERDSSIVALAEGVGRLHQVAAFDGTATGTASSPTGRELLVTMRAGLVYRVDLSADAATPEPRPVLDLSALTTVDGERGLFDVAFGPSGRAVYFSYTASDGAVTVIGMPYRAGQALPLSRAWTVLRVPHPNSGHNGGALAFASARTLLISIGDGDRVGPGTPAAQDPSTSLGGIVAVPLGGDGRRSGPSRQIAKGLRNPWRMSVDPDTGTLWVGDVGEHSSEEIDTLTAPGSVPTVTNYGWPVREGNESGPRSDLSATGAVPPVLTRSHDDGVCGMVAGVVYRGLRFPALSGAIVYGDLCSSELRAAVVRDGRTVGDVRLAAGPSPPISIDAGPRGEIYVSTADGRVLRLDPGAGGHGPTPSTVAPEPVTTAPGSPEVCGAVLALDRLAALVSTLTTSPPELEAAFDDVISRLSRPSTGEPPAVSQAKVVVLAGMRVQAGRAARLQWDLRDPEAQRLISGADQGDPPVAGFFAATEALVVYRDRSC